MKFRTRIVKSALLLFAGLSCAAAAQSLTILAEIAPPAQTKTADGKLGGYAVEIVREIQRRIGNTDPIQEVLWARGYNKLQREPNTVLFTVARTADRDPLFHWVGPITEINYGLYVRADSRIVLGNLEDAKKLAAIGTFREDAREQILAKGGLTNLERATDNVKNFKKLMADRIDAMAIADTAVATIATSAGYQAENVKLALTFAQIQIWIAFSKTTPAATVKAWSDALEAMKKDKTFETIMKREGGKKQDAHVTETPRRSGVSTPGAAK